MTFISNPSSPAEKLWKVFGPDQPEAIPSRQASPAARPVSPEIVRGSRTCSRGARCQPRNRPRRDAGDYGPVGLRQVDPGALPVAAGRYRPRGYGDGRRARIFSSLSTSGGLIELQAFEDGHGVPELRRCCRIAPCWRMSPFRCRCAASRATSGANAPWRVDQARGPRRSRGSTSRASFRAGSNSASASPAAWRSSLTSGSWTNRFPPSIR